MTGNEILILNMLSSLMAQFWSYLGGFVFFGVSLTSMLSAMFAVGIILPFLYNFTSPTASFLSKPYKSVESSLQAKHAYLARQEKNNTKS